MDVGTITRWASKVRRVLEEELINSSSIEARLRTRTCATEFFPSSRPLPSPCSGCIFGFCQDGDPILDHNNLDTRILAAPITLYTCRNPQTLTSTYRLRIGEFPELSTITISIDLKTTMKVV